MIQKFSLMVTLCASIFVLSSCSSSKKVQSDSVMIEDEILTDDVIIPDSFSLPDMPSDLVDTDARAEYLAMHYWDKFDFSDESLISVPEVTEQAFVDYINILYYVPFAKASESLKFTLIRAQVNREMYSHFASLFEKYYYEPNSPFRNEEFYIPVLQDLAVSKVLDNDAKSRYSFQLEMSNKNRVGQSAADFTFTLASGESRKLSSIKSEYIILMFSNPDCSTCTAVTAEMVNSDVLKKVYAMNSATRNMITTLTVYPFDDIEDWTAHLPFLPSEWINAYDKDMSITRQKIYDIKATPTLYLLDSNKKVILKDTTLDTIESFFEIS